MADDLAFVERAAVAEEIAASLRHDLKNKFAAIRNAAFYIQRCVAKTELWQTNARMEQFFQLITEQLGAANDLLDDRATFGHAFAHETSPVRLGACMEEALQSAGVPAGVTVAAHFEDSAPLELARREIAVALRCVLDNAIEAMDGRGVLTLHTFARDSDVVATIADTGPGFSSEQLERGMNVPFASTKAGHAGLGLRVARRITERYRGAIRIEAHAGHALVELAFPTRGVE